MMAVERYHQSASKCGNLVQSRVLFFLHCVPSLVRPFSCFAVLGHLVLHDVPCGEFVHSLCLHFTRVFRSSGGNRRRPTDVVREGDTVCVITCVGQCDTRWSVDLRYDELLCESCRFLVLQSADSLV